MTVSEIIEIAQISQFMAANDIAKNGLHTGGGAYLRLPRHLYMVRKNVERMYELDPTDDALTATSNYLLALCGKYRFAAQNVTGSGGTIAPITPAGSSTPNDLDFEVSASSIMATGSTSITLSQFIGYNVDFARGGIMQNTTNLGDGSSYYSWNNVTGVFTIFPAASVGELFRIMPDTGGGSASVVPSQTYPFVITSANFEADGVTYNNASIVGDNIMMFVSGFNSEWQFAGTFFNYTASGIEVIWPGFDAADFGNIIIQKIN